MLTKKEAIEYIDDIQKFAFDNGRKDETWFTYHNHVFGVAVIAEKIAEKLRGDVDPEKAFVLGLLHDCGKLYEDYHKRFHGVIGYDMFKDVDISVAKIALDHSFFFNKVDGWSKEWQERYFNNETDYKLTLDVVNNKEYDIYTPLIQLCDCLANCSGFVTLEERREEFLKRHPGDYNGINLDNLYELKALFDKKLGYSVYDLYPECTQEYFIDETYKYIPKKKSRDLLSNFAIKRTSLSM